MATNRAHDTGNNAITLGFAFLSGIGTLAMIAAAMIGVIQGTTANTDSLGLLLAIGVTLFLSGSLAWLSVRRPWESFDDINVPKYHGHHHNEHETHTEVEVEEMETH